MHTKDDIDKLVADFEGYRKLIIPPSVPSIPPEGRCAE